MSDPKLPNDATFDRTITNDRASVAASHNGGYRGGEGFRRVVTPGGSPEDNSQPAFPVFHRKFGNPAPLGLISFAATTFLLSLLNIGTRGITVHNVILGMAMGYGGLSQIIVGIEEWACGNTFGATAFCSYGGFWISFGILYIPQFAVLDSYTDAAMLDNALGLYLVTWGMVTFIFVLASLRSSVALISVFVFLDITFWLLAAGYLGPSTKCTTAGGAFGIITSALAAYTGLAGMLTKDTSYFLLPVGDLSR